MFDEQYTVEMVELMLKQASLELVSFDLDLVSIKVDASHEHLLGADDVPRQPGHRQAAFLVLPLAVGFDNLRIDQGVRIFTSQEVVDEQALANSNLWRGKAEPRLFVHGLEHVFDQANQRTVDVGDILGDLFEHRVAVVTNSVWSTHLVRIPPVDGTVAPVSGNHDADHSADNGTAGHYFDNDPAVQSNPRSIELVLPDVYLGLTTDSGVFSGSKVDAGSRYLLQEHPPIPPSVTSILDLGCGYGPIALAAAKRAPAAQVFGIDVNLRALDLAQSNARDNSIENAHFTTPDAIDRDIRFDLILSNPPIRIGKEALHALLTDWFVRLSPGGVAWMVVQKHLGSDSLATWLTDQGWPTARLGSRKGFRILESVASGSP